MNVYSTPYHTCWTMDGPVFWSSAPQEMICSICTDKAEGYHFGAISCAACGAFFRRSVSDQKVYACSNRQCNIIHDPKKRGGSCRFCRFLKCVNSGMMPQDVRAKRNVSQQNVTSLYRSLNQTSAMMIDQLIGFRRAIAAERNQMEAIPVECVNLQMSGPTSRTNLMMLLQQDCEILKRIGSGFPLFMQTVENIHLHLQQSNSDPIIEPPPGALQDLLSDIFLVIFIFEACFLTSSKGGVQLDRLLLPDSTFIDLSEPAFFQFLQCEPQSTIDSARNVHNAFSFLVQMVSRSFQSSNFDESYLAILFYTVITEYVPAHLRHHFAELNRETLLADVNKVDAPSCQQFHTITAQIHQGTRAFKEIIASFG